MSKKKLSIGEAAGAYRARVNERQFIEKTVSELGMKLREKESQLRDVREQERRALATFEQAVEDAE